ncbi:MAG: preprotein translocase subunit SecE [bacterium]
MKKLYEMLRAFVLDVKVEMAKVSWPTRDELKGSTVVVIIVTLAFALFTFGIDRALSFLVRLLYSYSGS